MCLDDNENIFVVGNEGPTSLLQGLIMKVSFDGYVQWIYQPVTALTLTMDSVLCNSVFAYAIGASAASEISYSSGSLGAFIIKYHTSGATVYAKGIAPTSASGYSDSIVGSDVS